MDKTQVEEVKVRQGIKQAEMQEINKPDGATTSSECVTLCSDLHIGCVR